MSTLRTSTLKEYYSEGKPFATQRKKAKKQLVGPDNTKSECSQDSFTPNQSDEENLPSSQSTIGGDVKNRKRVCIDSESDDEESNFTNSANRRKSSLDEPIRTDDCEVKNEEHSNDDSPDGYTSHESDGENLPPSQSVNAGVGRKRKRIRINSETDEESDSRVLRSSTKKVQNKKMSKTQQGLERLKKRRVRRGLAESSCTSELVPNIEESSGEEGESHETFQESPSCDADEDLSDFIDDSEAKKEEEQSESAEEAEDEEQQSGQEYSCSEEDSQSYSESLKSEMEIKKQKKSRFKNKDFNRILKNLQRQTSFHKQNERKYLEATAYGNSSMAEAHKKKRKRKMKTLMIYPRLIKGLRMRAPALSRNKTDTEVLNMWKWYSSSEDDKKEGICVCGKTEIRYYHWIHNIEIEDMLEKTFSKIYVGSECIKWFCQSTGTIIDEDGEVIDSPILLADIFLRKGVRAIYKGQEKVENPFKDEKDDEEDLLLLKEITALKFHLSGNKAKYLIQNEDKFSLDFQFTKISEDTVELKIINKHHSVKRFEVGQKYEIFMFSKVPMSFLTPNFPNRPELPKTKVSLILKKYKKIETTAPAPKEATGKTFLFI